MQPIIGGWIDSNRAEAVAAGLTGVEQDLATGQGTLQTIMFFPIILIVMFTILFFWMKGKPKHSEASMAH
jgi:hypothetical protein